MKYKLSIIILALGVSAIAIGQADSLGKTKKANLVSKKGVFILPEKGEIALGIDAWPVFYYLGGIFSYYDATPPSFDLGNDFGGLTGIYGKYMLQSDLAIRANFRCDFSSSTDIYVVPQSTLTFDPLAPQYVEDQITYYDNVIHLGVGIEKLRGSSRVQGKYGAELVFGYAKYTTEYNYGNSITNEFNTPATFNNVYDIGGERILTDYYNKGLYIGARGFIGLEFFVGPKISLGGEFGYSLVYQWSQNRTTEYQYWNSSLQEVSTVLREFNNDGYDDMWAGIDNLDGSINLFFYF
jgi:hypothetical protein